MSKQQKAPLIAKRHPQWEARTKILCTVFPWSRSRILAIVGLSPDAVIGPGGKHEDNLACIRAHELYLDGGNAKENREQVVAIHKAQNAAWEALTNLPPLGTDTAWRAAGRAAGAPMEAVDSLNLDVLSEYIIEWALSLVAKQPSQTRVDDEPPVEWSKADSPAEWARLFGCSPRVFVSRVKQGIIRAKKQSTKSYQIDVRDIPTTKRR